MNRYEPICVIWPTRVRDVVCQANAWITPGHDGGEWEPPQPTDIELTVTDGKGRAVAINKYERAQLETEALEEYAAIRNPY